MPAPSTSRTCWRHRRDYSPFDCFDYKRWRDCKSHHQQQLDRVKRWLARIEPKEPRGDYGRQDDYADFLRAFFIEAWHLFDWIKHDRRYSVGGGMRDKALKKPNLNICKSLANLAKHSELDLKQNIDVKPEGTDVTIGGLGFTGGPVWSKYGYRIKLPDGTQRDSLGLVREILSDWEIVIKDHVEPTRKP